MLLSSGLLAGNRIAAEFFLCAQVSRRCFFWGFKPGKLLPPTVDHYLRFVASSNERNPKVPGRAVF